MTILFSLLIISLLLLSHCFSQLFLPSSNPKICSLPPQRDSLMERNRRRQPKSKSKAVDSEEVSSIEWENIVMSEQEEDLIYRMHNLVGDRWDLIAGRIPGRTMEQVERFWIMRHSEGFASAGRKNENRYNKKAKCGVFIR